jgi:tetratricopeptide (TPR) repeat protein
MKSAKEFKESRKRKERNGWYRMTTPEEIAASKRAYRDLERGYRRAIALDPKLAAAWTNLASILDIRNRLDEAAKAARMAVHLDPDLDNIAILARIRAQQGYRPESQAMARKLLRSKAKSEYARRVAADILRGTWDPHPDSNPAAYRFMIQEITNEVRAKMRPLK